MKSNSSGSSGLRRRGSASRSATALRRRSAHPGAAAVGNALKILVAGGFKKGSRTDDLAIAALRRRAREGDPAAKLVLDYIIRRMRDHVHKRPATDTESN